MPQNVEELQFFASVVGVSALAAVVGGYTLFGAAWAINNAWRVRAWWRARRRRLKLGLR